MSLPLEKSDPASGTVDWRGAEEYMRGKGDGEEAGEDGTTPETAKEFKYRGTTVKVDAATHDLLESLRREARGTNGRLGSELSQARERLARLEGAFSAQPQRTTPGDDLTPPDPILATKDIAAWQRQYDEYHTAKTTRQMEALEKKHFDFVRNLETRTHEAQAQKQWADTFYQSYDHLDHPELKPIVAQAYTEHKEEIDAFGTDLEGAYERLAELADARLIRLRAAGRDADTPNSDNHRRPPRIESSAGPAPRGKVEDTPREFSAASWAAKQRLKLAGREAK
jgi:hypothetical protein